MRWHSDYFSMCDKCGKIISYKSIYHFLRKIRVRCQKCFLLGKFNSQWKGNNVGYTNLHNYIRRHKPKPKFCEICKLKSPKDLHNKNKKYKRNINDYLWLCRSCHKKVEDKIRKGD